MKRIRVIDSHTGGEPTRLVIDGFPDFGGGTVAEQLAVMRRDHDQWRRTTVLEPRGNDVIVGAVLCPPSIAGAAAGVIFFNNAGYLGMCGHGTIGVVRSLHHLGRIGPGVHLIETPVGSVQATLHDDLSVSVRNVPAKRLMAKISVDVEGYGRVTGDVAWGGNWFFLVSDHGQRIAADHVAALTNFSRAERDAVAAAGITGDGGHAIDHVELIADDAEADCRNFVLCPGAAYDRSPCGTGTSAKLACLAADGKLQPGETWVQKSVIGSVFRGSYERAGDAVIPTIRGEAHISAETTLIVDETDPFAWGIPA